MPRGQLTFKQRDVARALRAAREYGGRGKSRYAKWQTQANPLKVQGWKMSVAIPAELVWTKDFRALRWLTLLFVRFDVKGVFGLLANPIAKPSRSGGTAAHFTCSNETDVTLYRLRRASVIAGSRNPVARQAHNLEVGGSNPLPATNLNPDGAARYGIYGNRIGRQSGSQDCADVGTLPRGYFATLRKLTKPVGHPRSDPPRRIRVDEIRAAAWEAKAVRTSTLDEKQMQSTFCCIGRRCRTGGGDSRGPWVASFPERDSARTKFHSGDGLGIQEPRSIGQGMARDRVICPAVARFKFRRRVVLALIRSGEGGPLGSRDAGAFFPTSMRTMTDDVLRRHSALVNLEKIPGQCPPVVRLPHVWCPSSEFVGGRDVG